jgi:hypothetical protein
MTEDNSKISRRLFVVTGAATAAGVALRLHRIRPSKRKISVRNRCTSLSSQTQAVFPH